MTIYEIFFLAVILSIDAFIVAFSYGLCKIERPGRTSLYIACGTGFFQFFMPLIGALIANIAFSEIESFGKYIAGGIFIILGIKIFKEYYLKPKDIECECVKIKNLSAKTLISISIATSIDALAAGSSIMLLKAPVLKASFLIGFTTFILASAGFWIGHTIKTVINNKAPNLLGKFGAIILILMGLKVIFL